MVPPPLISRYLGAQMACRLCDIARRVAGMCKYSQLCVRCALFELRYCVMQLPLLPARLLLHGESLQHPVFDVPSVELLFMLGVLARKALSTYSHAQAEHRSLSPCHLRPQVTIMCSSGACAAAAASLGVPSQRIPPQGVLPHKLYCFCGVVQDGNSLCLKPSVHRAVFTSDDVLPVAGDADHVCIRIRPSGLVHRGVQVSQDAPPAAGTA